MSKIFHEIVVDDILKTNEWAWFLGFLWADGSVTDNNMSLEIQADDFDDIWPTLYVIGFRTYSERIRENKYRQKTIGTSKCSFFLNYYGFKEKSKNPPDELWKILSYQQKLLFLRGFFEGDGSYAKYNSSDPGGGSIRITLNGPKEYDYSFILKFFDDNDIAAPCIERKDRIQSNKTRSYSILSWCKISEVLKIFNLLYSNNLEIGLSRKRNIALSFIDKRKQMCPPRMSRILWKIKQSHNSPI